MLLTASINIITEMLRYIILTNLFFTLKALVVSSIFILNSNKCGNQYLTVVYIRDGSSYLLRCQMCIIHKANVLCNKILSKSLMKYSGNTSKLIRKYDDSQTFNLQDLGHILSKRKQIVFKNKCVPQVKIIIILNSIYSLTGHLRKLSSYRKSYGFHTIKKRNVANGDFEAKFNLINLVDGLNEQYISTDLNDIMTRNEKNKNAPREDLIKSKIQKIIGENGHLTLNCPEVTLESKVEWYKNNRKLNSSFRNNMAKTEKEPHLTIDAYNSLYILQATKDEEGIYTCYVDCKPIQAYFVKVVSKSKLLNQEFFKYSIYLGFVLSLTITCYCAGICVAWHQRNYFADPLYLSLIC